MCCKKLLPRRKRCTLWSTTTEKCWKQNCNMIKHRRYRPPMRSSCEKCLPHFDIFKKLIWFCIFRHSIDFAYPLDGGITTGYYPIERRYWPPMRSSCEGRVPTEEFWRWELLSTEWEQPAPSLWQQSAPSPRVISKNTKSSGYSAPKRTKQRRDGCYLDEKQVFQNVSKKDRIKMDFGWERQMWKNWFIKYLLKIIAFKI